MIKLSIRRNIWALIVATISFALAILCQLILFDKRDALSLWGAHTNEVIRLTTTFELSIVDLENSLRGYLITGKERYLKNFLEAGKDAQLNLAKLQALTLNNQREQERLEFIQRQLKEQIRLSQVCLTANTEHSAPLVQPAALEGRTERIELIKSACHKLAEEETDQLIKRRKYGKDLLTQNRWLAQLLGIFGVTCLAWFLFMTRRFYIQERKVTRELQQSNELFKTFMNNAPVSVFMKDASGRLVFANKKMEEVFKSKVESFLGKTELDWLPEEVAKPIMEFDQRVLNENRTITGDEHFPMENGQTQYWQSVKFPVVDSHGTRLLAGVSIDVSNRKRAEQQAAEQEALMRLIIDSIADAVIVTTETGEFLVFNPAASKLRVLNHATVKPELWNQYFELRLPDQNSLCPAEQLPNVRALKGEHVDEMEMSMLSVAGERLRVSISARPIKNDDGTIERCVVIISDITDRKSYELSLKEARDEAVKANQMKSQFLANMSHEIRTPMAGILGLSEFLSTHESLDSTAKEMAHDILLSAQALMHVVNDLLDLSKLEAGKMLIDKSPFDVAELVNSVVINISAGVRAKNLSNEIFIDPRIPQILLGDENRIRQALLNLAQNAVKFTDSGTVKLSLNLQSLSDDLVSIRFSVTDTGIGIDPSVQKDLFQPFVQADGSPTRRYGGTGLGLSIVKKLVELMSGEIGIESSAGQGSEFWFTVPLQTIQQTAIS
jgi:PAS domain S-box-containing protein